jgi:hypothetical protein
MWCQPARLLSPDHPSLDGSQRLVRRLHPAATRSRRHRAVRCSQPAARGRPLARPSGRERRRLPGPFGCTPRPEARLLLTRGGEKSKIDAHFDARRASTASSQKGRTLALAGVLGRVSDGTRTRDRLDHNQEPDAPVMITEVRDSTAPAFRTPPPLGSAPAGGLQITR